MSLITTRSLYKIYKQKQALKDINIDVQKGEIFILIGPTGAGKTTLLRLLDILDMPTAGEIYFDGINVTQSKKVSLEIRRRMAFVLQKPAVFNMSVYENMACGLKWRGTTGKQMRREVDNALEMVDLTEYKTRNARTLSGGEAQRVAIARAMITEPEVLLMDEPTANLDPISTSKIEGLISRIIHQYNTTIVMSTHDMSQGQRLANKIAVLINGEAFQVGDVKQIFNQPQTKEVAEFVGIDNIIDGVIVSHEDNLVTIDAGGQFIEAISNHNLGQKVYACIRPEEVILTLSQISSSARNRFRGKIVQIVSEGLFSYVSIDCGFPLTALITNRSAGELSLKRGKEVYASFKATGIHVVGREIGREM